MGCSFSLCTSPLRMLFYEVVAFVGPVVVLFFFLVLFSFRFCFGFCTLVFLYSSGFEYSLYLLLYPCFSLGPWVRWLDVCKPKTEGGLGIRDQRLVNLALLEKWYWRLITRGKDLWKDIVGAR